jgi:hypothetical protein
LLNRDPLLSIALSTAKPRQQTNDE